MNLDCWACRAGLRHDEDNRGSACPHDDGQGSASCCADEIARRLRSLLDLRAMVLALRAGPPPSPRVLVDPVGAYWFEDPAPAVGDER